SNNYLRTFTSAHGVREEPQFVTARAGDSVVLGCDVSHPLNGQQTPYVVEWFKFGVPIPFFINFRFYPPHVDPEYTGRASLHGKASLQIDHVRSEDQGWYECRVLMLEQQYDTFHNGSWVHLTVNAPPTFTDTPPQYVEAREGGSITLTCTAFGNPKPVVTWLRDGDQLTSNKKYTVSDGSLTVQAITREDRGAYSCRAQSDQGEVLHTTRLLVQGEHPQIAMSVYFSQNYRSKLICSCHSILTFQFFQIFSKCILICGTIANMITHVFHSCLDHILSADPARVVKMPPVIYVPRKLPGIIRCPVDANPPVMSVRWEKDGYPLRIEKYPGWSQMADGSIRVAEVTEDSLGTYTCVPYNVLGTMGQSPPATLVLKDPPYFNVRPGGEYRQEAGRELVIPCAASGDPEIPTIVWRKVGKPSRSKYNILPSGSLQFVSLSKEDHGEWECVATNVVTSITASTRLFVIGTSPHAPTNVHVSASTSSANVSWEPGYDGGFEQTFSVWNGPNDLGPHDWLSIPVPGSQTWLVVQGLEPKTAYQFSVLAQNKLGTGPFSEVVTVTTGGYPISTPEPLVLLTPPRCLTANRTQQGVLLTWLPPANHSSPIDRYIIEFRLGERWEVLDDLIPATETEIIARDLIQDSWYEFRALAVMDDLVSESSNVVGVSSTDPFPPTEISDEGLAKPVVAGIVATICFLAAAILFSTLAACFVNKQHRRKLKRKRDPPLSITHTRKSIESPLSSGKISPESITSSRSPSLASMGGHGLYVKKLPSPRKEKELSLYMKTKRAITSKKYSVSKHEAEVTTPIELISRGPDGRFVMVPSDIDTSLKPRRIEGFPFVEESDLYPEFRQSDEENDDPGPLPPVMATLRPQISPVSSSQESYMQPPAYSPRFQRPMEGMSILEGSRLQATGQSRVSHFHRVFPPGPFYGYLGSGAEVELHPPFYMPDVSPRSSAMSSSPSYPSEGPFRHPTIPEEREEIHEFGASGHALPLVHSPPSSRSTEIWQPPDFPFLGQEGPRLALPPRHSSYLHRDLPEPPPYPSHSRTLSTTSQLPSSSAFLQLEAPRAHLSRSPSRFPLQGPSAKHITMQQAQTLGQLRHTAHGMGVPVLPYLGTTARMGSPSTLHSESSDGWRSEAQPWLSPRAARRMDLGLQQVVLQPSRLSPLTQTPPSSHAGSPDILVRPPPRPSILRSSRSQEMPESARHPASVSFSRRSLSSSPATSPTQGQNGQRPSLSYHAHMAFATAAASYPSQSPSPPAESSDAFGQMPSQRRTDEEMLPSEPSPG
uniref:Immunoglobulin superfamily, member 9Ba n=1 Tax=Sinocyclocheilus grahami TaxID=75366 RepID=A0A672RB11_SINGR